MPQIRYNCNGERHVVELTNRNIIRAVFEALIKKLRVCVVDKHGKRIEIDGNNASQIVYINTDWMDME